ncbi:hypothetical protein [Streptomyces sp. NPDC051001]|uniref:hypothetical protein n=1 Tax=Streptomyces sp. NPDC051001 TaxID=3155795 RepID=UPI003435878A
MLLQAGREIPADALWIEYTALRNAAFVLVVGLSMMRNIEVRDILKDSVVEYYGSPAVKATKHKLDPDLPIRHWWIIEPVAKAIMTAAELSIDDEYAFASVQAKSPINHFDSGDAINDFVRHANHNRQVTGLAQIAVQKLAPHMFRRTMAMLIREFPGSEIAVGMQLKHVATRALANTTTQGYTEPSPAWAQHLRSAISERSFERLAELFAADGRGEPIGYGPGADRLRETFAAIRAKAAEMKATNQAQRGDLRVELDLLRRTRLSVRFGKLNHCTMDDANPVGAKCLEDAIVPEGHQGPLIDRCQPSRCANSVIAPAHLPIWTTERASLIDLLATRKLPPSRRALLTEQLHDVDRVIRKAPEAFRDFQEGRLPAGPGARSLIEAFALVDAELKEAARTDPKVLKDDAHLESLLRKQAQTLHVGAANFCWFRDPAKALCLRLAGTPNASKPLVGMCDSARCPQATHHPCHRPVWTGQAASITVFLKNPRVPTGERKRLLPERERALRVVSEIDAAMCEGTV